MRMIHVCTVYDDERALDVLCVCVAQPYLVHASVSVMLVGGEIARPELPQQHLIRVWCGRPPSRQAAPLP